MSWFDSAVAGWYRSKIASADAVEQGISALGSSIGRAIEETRQNSVANQIGSQMANSGDYAPRAGLVSPGTNPDTGDENTIAPGTDTTGTAPAKFTGGYKGLQLQTAIDSMKRQNANTQSEIGLRNAQSGYYGAHTDYLNKQSDINQQRADTYSKNAANKANQDTVPKLSTELNDTFGKGAAPKILSTFGKDPSAYRGDTQTINGEDVWVPNPNGSMFSPNAPKPNPADKGGLFGIGAHPEQPQPLNGDEILIPWSDAQSYMKRYQNAQSPSGQPQAQGGNLPQVNSAQDYSQVPSGARYQDPQGNIRIKP